MNRQDAAEELKTADGKNFAPLEVEEGRGGETGAKAWESRAAPVIAFVKRHLYKVIAVVVLVILLAILIPILWFKEPTVYFDGTTNLTIRRAKINVDLAIRVKNPNAYTIHLDDLDVNLYDFQDTHIGRVQKGNKFKLPAGKTVPVPLTAEMSPSLLELAAIGIDCLANDNHTKVRMKGVVKVVAGSMKFNVVLPSDVIKAQCIVLENQAGAGGAGGAGINIPLPIPPINIGPIQIGGGGGAGAGAGAGKP